MKELKALTDEMKIRGYSWQTIRTYWYINIKFLEFTKKSPRQINKKDIEHYLVCLYNRKVASASRHLICSALKFYYESVLKRRFRLKHPKKARKLGTVLSKREILKMIEVTENPKHRLLIELMYGSGLRVGELVKVRIEDFDIENRVLHIKQGKGNKDRLVNLSERFMHGFLDYSKGKKSYLFQSWNYPTKHITIRTAQQIIKNALTKAKIDKKAHCHTLRASYATHLIENGIDISYVQKLLGHSRVDTTRGYIRLNPREVSNVRSPLD